MNEAEFNINGYNLFGCNIGRKPYRGIIMYVDNKLSVSQVDILPNFSEYLVLNIKDSAKYLLTICAIYRSPSSRINNDVCMFELLSELNKQYPNTLLCFEDFNYCKINWFDWSCKCGERSSDSRFIKCLRDNFLSQHVLFPTRVRGTQTPHVLDLILSNNDLFSEVINLSPLGKSDHSVLHCICNLHFKNITFDGKLNFNKGNYHDMRKHLKNKLSELCHCDSNDNQFDIESEWISFKNTLMSSAKVFIPATVNMAGKRKPNWIYPVNKDTKALIKRKHRLWTRFQETRDVKVHADFKKIRNLVRKETRKTATNYQSNIAHSCKKNPKKFWQFINSKSKTVKSIGNIVVNDLFGDSTIFENDLDKANAFNEYFISVCASVPIQAVNNLTQIMPCNSMDELMFSEDTVLSKLNKLKTHTSPGPDLIHPKILYEMRDIVSPYLCIIYQQSLIQGYLPTDWKSSFVTVIHKKGKKSFVGNYRPISLTSICCKIFESIIKDNIVYYFKSNNLFSKFQYGFINGRSVLIQLLKVLDDWTSSIDNGDQVDIVYTDFEKAFDRISHKHLISKLLSYGINDKLVAWISSFLCDRTQCVKINGVYSGKNIVPSGVPQGSVLGPLLFVVFINDLPDVCSDFSSLFLFADDAKLYRTLQCDTDYLMLQDCCQFISVWAQQWCMNLNVDKCKVLSITANKCNKKINN